MLDLPEQSFREIFQYLDFETIYFSMRNICQKLKHYVDGFIQLGGIFMLAGGRDVPIEILQIFKQYNKETTVCSTLADPYPYPTLEDYPEYDEWFGTRRTTTHLEKDFGSFGAMVKDKIVIGIY